MGMLDGIKVLSLNHFLLGPLAAQVLGDLGADVVMVEPAGGSFSRTWAGGDIRVGGRSVFFLCAHRNKRSIVVDLKSDGGREVVRRLIARSDVLVENFRPGVLARMGLGWEEARAINPMLIYASGSGWGGSGPYATKPGQDLLMQAFCGIAETTGKDRPTPVGASIVDHHGGMILAASIMAALIGRMRDGKGHRVEMDLMSAALDLQVEPLVAWFNGGAGRQTRPKQHIAGWTYPAPYGIYPASDGHVALSLGPLDRMARALAEERLSRFREEETWSRGAEMSAVFAEATRRMTVAQILAAFETEGLWASRVNSFADLADDPQIRHVGVFEDVPLADGTVVRLVRHPATYDGHRPGTRIAPPELGADTAAILHELGYDEAASQDLRAEGCVA